MRNLFSLFKTKKNQSPIISEEIKKGWRDVWLKGPCWNKDVDICDGNNGVSHTYLTSMYAQVFSELLNTERLQDQLVTWALSILTGAGILSLALQEDSNAIAAILFILGLLVVTRILTKSIKESVDDRMDIARQLDRMHRVMGAFAVGFYYRESTLFNPEWYGWGFDEDKASNVRKGARYRRLIWCLCLFVILIIATNTDWNSEPWIQRIPSLIRQIPF